MMPHLFYDPLVILGLLWLRVLLHDAWPDRSATGSQRLTAPIKPPRKRSHEPKPFAGLTQRPHCAVCEHADAHPHTPPPIRPDPLPPTNRRPREVDASRHVGPHAGCRYRGWLGLGHLCANGHPSGGPWRPFHCLSCHGYCPEHHGTIFPGKQVAVELIVRGLACLAEG